jgi:hypothetical protein
LWKLLKVKATKNHNFANGLERRWNFDSPARHGGLNFGRFHAVNQLAKNNQVG